MSQQPFSTLAEFKALLEAANGPDTAAIQAAEERNGQLTKPPGALGRLEELAIWFAGWQGNGRPELKAPQVVVFAGNHGVTAQGVSAFPAEVTEQMVLNFQHGGAAINQLSKAAGAQMDVHALDLDRPTQDFTQGAAMNEDEVVAAPSGRLERGQHRRRPVGDRRNGDRQHDLCCCAVPGTLWRRGRRLGRTRNWRGR